MSGVPHYPADFLQISRAVSDGSIFGGQCWAPNNQRNRGRFDRANLTCCGYSICRCNSKTQRPQSGGLPSDRSLCLLFGVEHPLHLHRPCHLPNSSAPGWNNPDLCDRFARLSSFADCLLRYNAVVMALFVDDQILAFVDV